jgi:hypothetical protein
MSPSGDQILAAKSRGITGKLALTQSNRQRADFNMRRIIEFTRRYLSIFVSFCAIITLTGCIEWSMGRSLLGPDDRFGWWEGDIWSSENSQRLIDPYSFSHLVHGMAFYALLGVVARKLPAQRRFLMAVLLEAGWEILENSPIIIHRYRAVTISLGYVGDSILNSLSDVVMMSVAFLFAGRVRPWVSVAVVLLLEIGCVLWIRDNLTLNIIMLIYPIQAIKAWQMAGRSLP